jgi:hypothetical protein
MGSLSSPGRVGSVAQSNEVLLVAGFGDPAAADYAAHASRTKEQDVENFSPAALQTSSEHRRVKTLVVFLGSRLSEGDRRTLDDLLRLAGVWQTEFIAVVSSFRVHFGDEEVVRAENHVLARAREFPTRTVVFRPGYVLSPNSRASAWLRRFGFLYPLLPRRLRGCCSSGEDLFAAIESERQAPDRRPARVFTLLGPNRPWREVLREHRTTGPLRACLTVACAVLSLLMVGHLAALVLGLLARRWPTLRRYSFDTLRPHSLAELLALYNPHNYRHVKAVGYNNGVVHFGQRYPDKTIVSTVRCNRVAFAGADLLRADCGTTVRVALDFLAAAGQDLPVVPNYSYVALGTAFFVPIHGSAADFSTIADTITRVVLYDPVRDRMIDAGRDEPDFQQYAYNMRAEILLLELYLRVKPKSRYYVRRETLHKPGSQELLAALQDSAATNVEIRKSSAASDEVTVARYYKDRGESPSAALELPRDSLGRLWDRLEENPVTSFLMHALTRHFAWHVELFFTAEEFAVFWEGHRALPLRKLQLRYIRRDGLPHSFFRDHDCVSVDLFMLRRHRHRFEAWLKETFPIVRSNPGKQSTHSR